LNRGARLRVLACQVAVPATPDREARDAHVARLDRLLRECIRETPADLIVLPELSSIDYSRDAFDALSSLAEPLDGPTGEVFSRLARDTGTPLFYGIPRRDGERNLITQVAVGADGGRLGHFDKLHMAQFGASREKHYFDPGDHLLVVEVGGIRVAPIICYDIRFPELARTLCQRHGAELLLHCSAYVRDETYYSWHPFVVTRALENQVHVLSLNRAGERFGRSIFCPPWVDDTEKETVLGEDETCRIVEVDLDRARAARDRYTLLTDCLGNSSVYDALETHLPAGTQHASR
jgi:predicted amidohydrolase